MAHGRTIRMALAPLAGALLAACAADSVVPGGPPLVVRTEPAPPPPVPATATATAATGAADGLPDGMLLVGMTASRVDDLLGRPEMVMNAGPAQWWRYAVGGCTVEVFLIARDSADPDDLVVSHVAVRSSARPGTETDLRSCRKPGADVARAAELAMSDAASSAGRMH
jgi:hypothetical protein